MGHWVTDQGRCTLDHILEDLYEVVQEDVKVMNALLKQENKKLRYEAAFDGEQVKVQAFLGDFETPSQGIFFRKKEGLVRAARIQVESKPSHLALFTVKWRWNSEELRCKLSVDGQDATLQDISRWALERSFFNSPPE